MTNKIQTTAQATAKKVSQARPKVATMKKMLNMRKQKAAKRG